MRAALLEHVMYMQLEEGFESSFQIHFLTIRLCNCKLGSIHFSKARSYLAQQPMCPEGNLVKAEKSFGSVRRRK